MRDKVGRVPRPGSDGDLRGVAAGVALLGELARGLLAQRRPAESTGRS